MNRLVEFPLVSGGGLVVEVEDRDGAGGRVMRGGSREVVERAQETFESAIEHLQPALDSLFARLGAVRDGPNQVEVQFGVQLTAEAGAFIVSGSTSGSFRVTLTWHRSVEEGPPGAAVALGAGRA